MPDDIALPERTPDVREAVLTIIGQACGHASLCWEPTPTGVFDSAEASRAVNEATLAMLDLLAGEMDVAFGIIANAHGGNWDDAGDEWKGAAVRFRDRYHAVLDARTAAKVAPDA